MTVQNNAVALIRNAARKQNPFDISPSERNLNGSFAGANSTQHSVKMRGIVKLRGDKIGLKKGSAAGTSMDIGNLEGGKLVNTLNPRSLNLESLKIGKRTI